MAYNKKIPPINLKLDNGFFNMLLEILTENEKIDIKEDVTAKEATKLKEKLLKYSIPFEFEGLKKGVNIRLYNKESSTMIEQLLVNFACKKVIKPDMDYYSLIQEKKSSKRK